MVWRHACLRSTSRISKSRWPEASCFLRLSCGSERGRGSRPICQAPPRSRAASYRRRPCPFAKRYYKPMLTKRVCFVSPDLTETQWELIEALLLAEKSSKSSGRNSDLANFVSADSFERYDRVAESLPDQHLRPDKAQQPRCTLPIRSSLVASRANPSSQFCRTMTGNRTPRKRCGERYRNA